MPIGIQIVSVAERDERFRQRRGWRDYGRYQALGGLKPLASVGESAR
jgi:hypothetical protein